MNLHVMGRDKTLLTKKMKHIDFQELWVSENSRGMHKQTRTTARFFVLNRQWNIVRK